MIKTIIVEDDPLHASSLIEKLAKMPYPLKVIAVCTNVAEAYESISKYQPELVFLDIDLDGGENGFDLLRRFKKPTFKVIFTTQHTSKSNMLRAIRVCALDFLAKPVVAEELADALLRFNDKGESNETEILADNIQHGIENPRWVVISNIDSKITIERTNILYAESSNVYTTFHLATAVQSRTAYTSSTSIKKWEDYLGDSDIMRVHREYLVNLSFCEKIVNKISGGASIILKDKTKVAVSKSRKKDFIERLKQFRSPL